MENTQNSIVYAVNSDLDDGILYAEFETKDVAIEYAKRNLDKLPFVDELQVSRDENGEVDEVFEYKTIWDHTMADSAEEETEDDYWDDLENMYDDSEKHVIGDTTWFESVDTDELVETLEENEDTVECKECFDLFPKADCIKVDFGYICPTCAEGGIVSEEDLFKIDFPEYEKMSIGNDMIPEEPVPAELVPEESSEEVPSVEVEDEIDPIPTPEDAIPFLVRDEAEAIAGYEKAAEVVEDSDLENKEEILDTIDHIKEEEEEHIEELIDLVEPEDEEDSDEDKEDSADDEEVENEEAAEEAAEALVEDTNAFSTGPITKDELYDRLVNKGEQVELDIGDQGYGPEDTGSFSDGGYYGGSVVYVEFYDGKFGATEFFRSESGDEKEGYWDLETESFDELWSALVSTFEPEDLVEHVNEEHPAIESDQELSGIDNAVVDCKVADVVTHSEDEKPVDCEGKKEPLNKALTEAFTHDELSEIFRLCKEIGIVNGEDLNRFIREVPEGENLLDKLRAYRAELGDDFKIKEKLTEAKRDPFHEAIFEAIDYLTEFSDIFPVPENIGAANWEELKDDINYGLSSDFEIAEIIMEYFNKDLAISKKHPEIFEDDPQSELTLETYERLKRAYDRAVEEYKAANPEDFEEQLDLIHGYDHIKSVATLVHKAVDNYTKENRVGIRPSGTAIYVIGAKSSSDPEEMKKIILDTLSENGYEPEVVDYLEGGNAYGYSIDQIKTIARMTMSYQKRESLTEDADDEKFNPTSEDPAEKPSKNVKMANTANVAGMDFETACQKFGVELDN